MDVTAAALGDLYVTAKDAKSSLTLGNVTDTFEFDVTIHNLSNQEKSVRYETTLQTDQVQDGKFTLHPRLLETIDGKETITVPANGQRTIHVTVDASKYKEELSKQMPNGYFLEGFVLVKDASNQKHLVSLPYVGFHGEYQSQSTNTQAATSRFTTTRTRPIIQMKRSQKRQSVIQTITLPL